jgi:hypothetical protein
VKRAELVIIRLEVAPSPIGLRRCNGFYERHKIPTFVPVHLECHLHGSDRKPDPTHMAVFLHAAREIAQPSENASLFVCERGIRVVPKELILLCPGPFKL